MFCSINQIFHLYNVNDNRNISLIGAVTYS